ncbi:probable N-acetyltransferase CML1 [Astyanax mexicanus]|uniref:probable N-acetyltransferase CML1 n=1 Tax=Astyanax mexicanus TaxID=7994 RepID=UPI0020CB55C0|nr:probable N-acetyltransferase CML1 [Astyanax mexicanus]
MAEVQIRCYEDGDEKDVKEIFALGLHGLLRSSCLHVLKQLHIQVLLVCVFCALLASTKSLLLPILAVTLLLAAGRQEICHMIDSYIEKSMSDDLRNIRQTYLEQPNSCLWVAEFQEQVVGMVACCPSERNKAWLELKRMSVRHSHRGQGIAKALCRAVEEFARKQSFPAVVLYTTVVQTDAQKLYECMGYKRDSGHVSSVVSSWITKFTVFEYMLDLQHPEN